MVGHALTRALARLVRRDATAARTLSVQAEPEGALLASAAALRRLGARITRYDADAGTLEARVDGAPVRIAVSAGAADTSRLALETEHRSARAFVRRLREELARPDARR